MLVELLAANYNETEEILQIPSIGMLGSHDISSWNNLFPLAFIRENKVFSGSEFLVAQFTVDNGTYMYLFLEEVVF